MCAWDVGSTILGNPISAKRIGRVLRLVGKCVYPVLLWASSRTRFELETEFEALIQTEPRILLLPLYSQTTSTGDCSTSSPQPFLHAEPQKPFAVVT